MTARRFRELFCDDEARRAEVIGHSTLNGIDYVEVSAASLNEQRFIHVFFLKPLPHPPPSDGLADHPELFRIVGGVRTRNIKVLQVTQVDEHLVVEVDRAGDFSAYTLVINSAALDPAYAQVEFSFKAGCPSRFDCRPRVICPPEPRLEPLIDYLAKDYASFRQALVDLIPTLVPDWKERHEADLGIALVELLAYVGDQLSYYQDAVANEAYLETARQRISVRRHARLIDYRMHDGASSRAFIHLTMNASGTLPAGAIQVLTRIDKPLGPNRLPHPTVIPEDLRDQALLAADAVFETMTEVRLHAGLNEINIHPWGNKQCCLPRGTTTVDLVGDLALEAGDFLLFEEVKGVQTGLKEDADPTHRQVVRLTMVEKTNDPLLDIALTRVMWDRADALTFPLCISVRLEDAFVKPGEDPHREGVSVARGNLVLADHGRTIKGEEHRGPRPPIHPSLRRAHRFFLNEGPLSFRTPMPKDNGVLAPARELLTTDPGQAKPQVRVKVASIPQDWDPVVPHLLDSTPFDRHFVAETDNNGRAQLRFGDGEYGMVPPDEEESEPDKSKIRVTYRVGVGTAGNIGAGSMAHVVKNDPLSPDLSGTDLANTNSTLGRIAAVRNPLPAWGGIDAEPIERVKQVAPAAFHAEQLRAVTEADYARAAEKHPEVSRAVATFRWTGSWHTVFITIDPKGRTDVSPELEQRVRDFVTRFTQAGYDLEIDPPTFVPLEIEIEACVSPDHFRGDVEETLLTELSNRTLPDGRRGFFHPDNFTFGQPLYLSQLYAAVEAVEGVDSAVVTIFQRFGKVANNELEQGFVPMNRLEVVRLDNDPNFPENGVLQLNMLGGK